MPVRAIWARFITEKALDRLAKRFFETRVVFIMDEMHPRLDCIRIQQIKRPPLPSVPRDSCAVQRNAVIQYFIKCYKVAAFACRVLPSEIAIQFNWRNLPCVRPEFRINKFIRRLVRKHIASVQPCLAALQQLHSIFWMRLQDFSARTAARPTQVVVNPDFHAKPLALAKRKIDIVPPTLFQKNRKLQPIAGEYEILPYPLLGHLPQLTAHLAKLHAPRP